ncbi:MAG: transporter, hydrophobe/amphiphile efflux family [Massilibacillus sp.]|nr:transporter, hydrophobe/amphiphile efflux family [Massilibacillus sp.]
MAKFFIERPIFAIVVSIMMVLIGTIAAVNLPIAQYPKIQPPSVTVATSYTGASADVVNQTVAQVIEQQVNGVEGMDYMTGTSADNGSYSLSVTFTSDRNSDIASVQTQNKVAQANASLPTDVQQVGITTKKSSSDMAYMVSLYSPNGTYDGTFLKNYADIYIFDAIRRVKGVGDIMIFGNDFSMRVWINPDKMAELNLTIAEVSAAIKEQNIQAPAGTIGQLPAPAGQEIQYTGKVKGRLTTAQDFENVIVRAEANGSFIYLKDIARIETGPKTTNVTSKMNGQNAVAFGVQLTNDANALETIGEVKKVLEDANKNFPPDMKLQPVIDNTEYVRESISEVVHTFVEALILVLLVVFLFLQSWRATLIPMLAIPVSLVATFGAFTVLGFSINTLTLFAMVLAIGLVVDDAIVVIEAVEHNMRYKAMGPKDATKLAMDEVSGPVVAIAFVLACVFIPVAFFGGMTGILYKQFALTIAVSMALSAFVALSLTPALCAMLLKPHDPNAHQGWLGNFFDRFNAWFEKNTNIYGDIVKSIIHHAKYACLFLLLVMIGTVALFKIVPATFVPEEDQGFFIAAISLPEGTSLNRTQETVKQVADAIHQQPGVKTTMEISGYDLLSSASKSNAGVVFAGLEPWSQRTTPATQIGAELGMLMKNTAGITNATIIPINMPALPGLGMVGGFTMMLQDMSGHTDEELDAITKKFVAAANQRPEIAKAYSTFAINSPNVEFEVDREKVKNLGVALDDVFTALQVNFGGSQVNDFNRFGRTYKVVMQADSGFRNEADMTRFLYVKSSSGAMIPLDTLLKPKTTTAAATITRFNGARSIQINGSAREGYSSGQALTAMEAVAKDTLPDGFKYEWSGQSREEQKAGNSTMIIFALAIGFVFLCLAALYESWTVPYAVLLCVPTGIFGALLAEYTRDLANSVYMQIGLVMLIGLAAKNAILIVEYAKVRVDRGMEVVEAAVEAAKLRLRPIIMTSLAFIIGCLPLAMATGAGAGARNAMGTAVVGGMIVATVMGIYLIPVMFVVVEKISAKFGTRKIKKHSKNVNELM